MLTSNLNRNYRPPDGAPLSCAIKIVHTQNHPDDTAAHCVRRTGNSTLATGADPCTSRCWYHPPKVRRRRLLHVSHPVASFWTPGQPDSLLYKPCNMSSRLSTSMDGLKPRRRITRHELCGFFNVGLDSARLVEIVITESPGVDIGYGSRQMPPDQRPFGACATCC